MEIEENQAHLIDHFVKQVSNTLTPSSLVNLIVQATSHSSLFAFSEILAVPNVLQVTLLFPILLFFLFFLSNLLLVEIM
jgi:COP9 signalosome complex subunit 7